MRHKTLLTLALLLLLVVTAHAQGTHAKTPAPLGRSRQLFLVTTRDWDAVGGTLRRFERRSARGSWNLPPPAVTRPGGR